MAVAPIELAETVVQRGIKEEVAPPLNIMIANFKISQEQPT